MYFEDEVAENYDEDLSGDQEFNSQQAEAQAAGNKNVLADIELLKASESNVPDTAKEKDLRACLKCKLILSESQWNKRKGWGCINCGQNEQIKTTPYFNGSVSLFMPSVSWVARWNNLEGNKPGVYAVSVIDSDYMEGYSDEMNMAPNQKTKKKNKKQNLDEIIYSDQDPNEFYD